MPSHSSVHHLRAIFFALVGYTCWVIGDTFMKLACDAGVPKYEIMAVGGIGGMAVIFLFTALQGGVGRLRPKNYRALFLLGLLFLMNYTVWVTALAHLPLANLYVVLFMAPMVVSVLASVFMREALTVPKILAILAGFIGVVIAVNPAEMIADKKDWLSYGIAFCGMLCLAAQMLTMRFIGSHENRESTAFYPRFGAVLGGLAAILIFGFEPISMKGVFYSLASGGIGGMGWMSMAYAYKLAPAATVAPFHYSEIITGALLGYLIWHDVPSAHLLVGAAIIIASGIYVILHTHKMAAILKNEPHVG